MARSVQPRLDIEKVSGAGMRHFVKIAGDYRLSDAEQCRILGIQLNSQLHEWRSAALAQTTFSLPNQTLHRLSGFIGIYKSLSSLFSSPMLQESWLRGEHYSPAFEGRPPIDYIFGSLDDLQIVKKHVEAWAAGAKPR